MRKLYIKDWLAYKPYDKEGTADIYYMNMSNQVIQLLNQIKPNVLLLKGFQQEEIADLAVFLVSYFEDIISGTGFFKTFKNISEELYGHKLPFYQDENILDDINVDDIKFLIWYFFNLSKQDFLFNPKHENFIEIAQSVYQIFDKAFEYAPENSVLKQFFSIKDVNTFDEVRYFLDKVLIKSYLFKYDIAVDFHFKSQQLITDRSQAGFQRYKSFRDYYVVNQKTKLLGLRSSEWVASMGIFDEKISSELKNLSENKQNVFRFIGLKNNDLQVEHLMSGKEVLLSGDNFPSAKKLPENALFSAGITIWKGKYIITGILWANEYREEIVNSYRNQFKSMNLFDTEQDKATLEKQIEWELNLFRDKASHKEFNIADVEKSISFINDFYDEVEKNHQINKEQIANMLSQIGIDKMISNILLFYNPMTGIEIYPNLPRELKIDDNPFFKEEPKDLLMKLMMSEEFSGEFYKYMKGKYNFKSELDTYSDEEQDFLLRFYKPNRYNS